MKAVRKAPFATATLVLVLLMIPASAQNASDQSDSGQTWNSSTSLQDQSGNSNPTRLTQSHREENGRQIEVQTLETKGINGGSQVYGQTETETVKVNATTTRVITRHYVTNSDGEKVVNSVSMEEKRELPDGGESVTRSVSNPDANGNLQVTRREIEKTVQSAPDQRTTDTTVLSPGPDGTLAPSTKSHEVQKKLQPGTTAYTRSVSLRDGNGNWQVNEIRQGTIEKAGDTETKRENVSRLNADGKMTLAEKTVSTETSSEGEQHKRVQKYSTSMDGVTAYPDGQMHLDRQVTTVTRTGPDGQQVTSQRVDQRSQAAPDSSLRPTQRVLDITTTGLDGVKQQTETIQSADPNGGMGVVWVDTKKTAGSGPVVVDTKKGTPEKSANPPQK
ncbi:MAG TPA: hypothetical protein VJ756_15905 [Terriglobales bacterium]|nr:hypothetical protein [Terriglobales bacterium]